jgi:hypothetical protein
LSNDILTRFLRPHIPPFRNIRPPLYPEFISPDFKLPDFKPLDYKFSGLQIFEVTHIVKHGALCTDPSSNMDPRHHIDPQAQEE